MDKSKSYLSANTGNKILPATLVLIVFLIIFYRDVVFFGKTFLIETAAPGTMPIAKMGPYKYEGATPGFVASDPGAIAWASEPINRYLSISVKRGDIPLWNPYLGIAGGPLLADGYTGLLEPIQFLFLLLPTRFWAYWIDLQLLIRFFIAGLGSYLFAKRLKLGFWGSVAVGVSFMLNGYFVTYGNHPQIKTEVLLPLIVYGYDRLADREDKTGFWWNSLFIGWVIVAAMPESTFFALLIGSLWFFYKTIHDIYGMRFSYSNVKTYVLRYLGSTILGFLIASAYLFPFLELVSFSKHAHDMGSGVFLQPLWSIPGLFIKDARSIQLSLFAFFILFYLLITLPKYKQNRHAVLFWGGYAILMTLALYNFPLTNWIRNLPILNQITFHKYVIPSIAFSTSIGVGIFIDRLQQFPLSIKKIGIAFELLIVLLIILPVFTNPSRSFVEYYSQASELKIFISYLIGTIVVFALALCLHYWKELDVQGLQVFVLVISVIGSFSSYGVISRPDRIDPYQVPPFVDYLRQDRQPYRIFALDYILYPNISSAYRISDVRWLNALVSARTYEFSERFIERNEVGTIRLTGTVLPISDQMFNLINVKYVLEAVPSETGTNTCSPAISPQPYLGIDTLHQQILEQNPDLQASMLSLPVTINGVEKNALQAFPPQEFMLKFNVPKENPRLFFSIGLHPERYLPGQGDGVNFKISILEDGIQHNLFTKRVDPQNNPCDRTWFDEVVSLNKWSGKEIILLFSTNNEPGEDDLGDWAYWGDVHLSTVYEKDSISKNDNGMPDYQLVYQDQDVRVFENKNVLPRAFVVYDAVDASSYASALDEMSSNNFDLTKTAVVENIPNYWTSLMAANDQGMSWVAGDIEQISSGRYVVDVSTKSPGLLVVTDQYYPGWKAYVDGEEVDLYAVDVMFRGVFLEAGNHKIEFRYQPLSFYVGLILSIVSFLSVLVLLFLNKKQVSMGN